MNRVASTILVACGAVLLATRLISPADSAPRVTGRLSMEERPDQDAATLETMRAEVDRLRERTTSDPGFPAPVRNPFSFGRRAEPPRPQVPVAPAPEIRQVILPELVAILSDGKAEDAKRTVVFSRGDNVDFVNVGEMVGAFRVESVTGDFVMLVDSNTGARYRLALAN